MIAEADEYFAEWGGYRAYQEGRIAYNAQVLAEHNAERAARAQALIEQARATNPGFRVRPITQVEPITRPSSPIGESNPLARPGPSPESTFRFSGAGEPVGEAQISASEQRLARVLADPEAAWAAIEDIGRNERIRQRNMGAPVEGFDLTVVRNIEQRRAELIAEGMSRPRTQFRRAVVTRWQPAEVNPLARPPMRQRLPMVELSNPLLITTGPGAGRYATSRLVTADTAMVLGLESFSTAFNPGLAVSVRNALPVGNILNTTNARIAAMNAYRAVQLSATVEGQILAGRVIPTSVGPLTPRLLREVVASGIAESTLAAGRGLNSAARIGLANAPRVLGAAGTVALAADILSSAVSESEARAIAAGEGVGGFAARLPGTVYANILRSQLEVFVPPSTLGERDFFSEPGRREAFWAIIDAAREARRRELFFSAIGVAQVAAAGIGEIVGEAVDLGLTALDVFSGSRAARQQRIEVAAELGRGLMANPLGDLPFLEYDDPYPGGISQMQSGSGNPFDNLGPLPYSEPDIGNPLTAAAPVSLARRGRRRGPLGTVGRRVDYRRPGPTFPLSAGNPLAAVDKGGQALPAPKFTPRRRANVAAGDFSLKGRLSCLTLLKVWTMIRTRTEFPRCNPVPLTPTPPILALHF